MYDTSLSTTPTSLLPVYTEVYHTAWSYKVPIYSDSNHMCYSFVRHCSIRYTSYIVVYTVDLMVNLQ